MTRIIIAGSRTFTGERNRKLLYKKMDALTVNLKVVTVLSGGAKGADTLGEDWAFSRKYTVERYHPEYDKYGPKRAPLERNAEMVQAAGPKGVLVAFWDGSSTGTGHILGLAKKAGLKVRIIRFDQE